MLRGLVETCVNEHIEKIYRDDIDKKEWLLKDERKPIFINNLYNKIIETQNVKTKGKSISARNIIQFIDGMAPLFCEVSLKYRQFLIDNKLKAPSKTMLTDMYGRKITK